MIQQRKPCCRCLLQDADEGELFEIIRQRIQVMPAAQRADQKLYEQRLSKCRECDQLISGTCRKCGCYVELRAAKKDSACPHENRRW